MEAPGMADTITATEARVHFGELLRRVVQRGETVVVERGGQPQAVVLSLAEYQRLVAAGQGASGWREALDRAHARIAEELQGRPLPAPAEVLRAAREERDGGWEDLR